MAVMDDDKGPVKTNKDFSIPVQLIWKNDRELVVQYPEKARILKRVAELDGVRVHYEDREEAEESR